MKFERFNVVVIIILMLVSTSIFAQGQSAANVNVVTAEMKMLSPVSWVSGTVVSRNNSEIAAEVSGRLESLAELGTLVKKGEVIAQVSDTTLKHIQKESMASVMSARARLAFLESEVKRKRVLAKQNLSAMTELDETISLRDAEKGALIAAQARLAQSNQNIEFSQLKAPFEGVVVERLSNLGEYVKNGSAIIRLVETKQLEASIFVPLKAYRFLALSQSIAIESSLGSALVKIKMIIPVAEARSHLMEVRLDMSAIDWPIGLSIKAAVIDGASKKVLSVPRDALVLRRNGVSLFKVSDQNIAEQISVDVGFGAGEWVEVKGDVKPGDKVIIRGAERLRVGQPVQIKNNNEQLILKQTSGK